MIYLKKHNPAETYMTPSGALFTPEETLKQFPAAAHFAHVVQTDEAGEVMFALQNLAAMRTQYGIDPALGEDAAIAAIQEIMNAEASAVPEPSAEERIAAAMEFQNAMSL